MHARHRYRTRKNTAQRQPKSLAWLLWLPLLTVLTACSNLGSVDFGPRQLPVTTVTVSDADLLRSDYTQLAPAQALPLLQRAVDEQRWELAERIANSADPQSLTRQLQADALARYSLLASTARLQNGSYIDALRWLEYPPLLAQLPLMRVQDQVSISKLRADALFATGSYSASARERIFIQALLEKRRDKQENADAIWRAMTKIPQRSLQQQLQNAIDKPYRSWLELALIHQSNEVDIEQQVAMTRDWRNRWPNHIAADKLPGSLQLLQTLADRRPQSIGLLLPLSGPLQSAGKAVQDGVTSAYFRSRATGWQVPTLTSYDTHTRSIEDLYQQAINDGCDLLIGPLEKNKVGALLTMPTEVPVITLNYVTNGMPPPGNIVQFGLAAEDEAQQLAGFAHLKEYEKVMLLRSSADWAARASQSFNRQWQQSGGTTVAETVLHNSEEFSSLVASSLHIPASQQRHRRLQQLTGQNLEFTPRRRDDIDAIILFANPRQASSIKPLLAYHYARDIPVLASSQVFAGTSSEEKHHDLNGMVFNEIPWVLENSAFKQDASEHYQNNKQLGRLFAMGVDAFFLHPRITQLQQADDSSINGLTGKLSIRENRISRELMLAEIKKGRVDVLEVSN